MSVTTAITLDKRRMIKNTKSYSVCLRVTFERRYRRYPLGDLQMTEADFRKLSAPNLGEKRREIKEKIEQEEQRAKKIIEKLNNFSFKAFGEQFSAFQPGRRRRQPKPAAGLPSPPPAATQKQGPGPEATIRQNFVNQFGNRKYPRQKSEIDFRALGEVAVYYGVYIAKLEAKDQAGTVNCYMCSLMSLLKHKPQLRFADVTDLWLYMYEKAMKTEGRSVTTISMYVRCLRRIFNMVIAKKIIDRDLYPFGRDLYVIPAGRKRKKALNMAQIQALFEYKTDNPIRQLCKDLWFFMYVANGMNVKDMCMLTYGQISERFCRFIRAKTINTTRENPQEIAFFCDDFILGVIARHGNADQSPDNYIFPFLTAGMDGYAIREKVQLITHLINKHMYAIAEALRISFLPGTNDARHAFATQLKRAGKSTEFIRELIGHESLKTTQNYLDDFEDETKIGITETLLPFRKPD
jgi:site-specific recombinase XerD